MASLLIVEDEFNIRQFIAINLKARGHNVHEATSAEEGLQNLGAHHYDALILDIRLPKMSGLDLLQALSADQQLRSLPVVVITASSSLTPSIQAGYGNVVRWLMKPVSVQDLLEAVEQAVRR